MIIAQVIPGRFDVAIEGRERTFDSVDDLLLFLSDEFGGPYRDYRAAWLALDEEKHDKVGL